MLLSDVTARYVLVYEVPERSPFAYLIERQDIDRAYVGRVMVKGCEQACDVYELALPDGEILSPTGEYRELRAALIGNVSVAVVLVPWEVARQTGLLVFPDGLIDRARIMRDKYYTERYEANRGTVARGSRELLYDFMRVAERETEGFMWHVITSCIAADVLLKRNNFPHDTPLYETLRNEVTDCVEKYGTKKRKRKGASK